MLPVDLTGIALDINSGAPMVVLQERDEPHRVLPIFVGPPEATAIAIAAAGQRAPQPLVHDVMTALVAALDGHVDAVEVNGLREGVFTAAISLSGPAGQRRVGSRPSDALALAVRTGAPVFVDEAVLDAAGHLPQEIEQTEDDTDEVPQLDEAAIDTAVESFRSFLDDIDPDDFAASAAGDDPSVDESTTVDDRDTEADDPDPSDRDPGDTASDVDPGDTASDESSDD